MKVQDRDPRQDRHATRRGRATARPIIGPTEAARLQDAKMAALGAQAAGLVHELNNPAAAVVRSAALLHGAIGAWQRSALALQAAELNPQCAGRAESLRSELEQRAAESVGLDPLAFSEREQEVQAWLEEAGVDEPWALAAPLVNLGWDSAALSTAVAGFGPAEVRALALWLATGAQVYSLLAELSLGAGSITEIVRAVKDYAHPDQAPIREIDVHAGIDDSLVIMRHKLKGGVVVRRRYAPDLPRIEAYASELKQVWTNLIDNAVDAMHGAGELTIATRSRQGSVVVEICDTGPGIPPEIQPHIFEPFFSTKAAGTGLGLHVVYDIVVQKHSGQVSITSDSEGTCFRVTLPVRPQQADRGSSESPEPAGRRSEPWNLQA